MLGRLTGIYVTDRVLVMRQTAKQQLIEIKLGRSVAGYVSARQTEGLSWRQIAADLSREVGITVSHESLRSWFKPQDIAA